MSVTHPYVKLPVRPCLLPIEPEMQGNNKSEIKAKSGAYAPPGARPAERPHRPSAGVGTLALRSLRRRKPPPRRCAGGAALLGPSWRRGGATPAPQLSPDVEALTGEGPGARAGRLDAAAPEASANTGGAGRA